MEFSRKKYWSGLPFPPPGVLPDPRMEPMSPALQKDSFPSELPVKLVATKLLMLGFGIKIKLIS